MGKVVTFFEPGKVGITDFPDTPLKPNEVRLQTLYSGISAGTELTHYRGSNVYLHRLWNERSRLFLRNQGVTTKSYPIYGSGYEECGKVVELGPEVTRVKEGALVYGTWQHRTHHVVSEEYAAARILPDNLDPILGIFSQMTAIAYNGILDAAHSPGRDRGHFWAGRAGPDLRADGETLRGAGDRYRFIGHAPEDGQRQRLDRYGSKSRRRGYSPKKLKS